MVATVAPKPRTKAQILKGLKKIYGKEHLSNPVLVILADIAYEFDCMIRDTSLELIATRKENAELKVLVDDLEEELLGWTGF